jgi:heme/copper-type cytochrome/quinol oxidase subunit 2
MVKMVYFPIYFRWRKRGDVRAQVLAAAGVFLVTWALHAYQSFWLIGQWTVSWTDSIFWTILGLLVIFTLLHEGRYKQVKQPSGWRALGMRAIGVLATFAILTTLWSLWSSPSIGAWIYLMTHWMGAGK